MREGGLPDEGGSCHIRESSPAARRTCVMLGMAPSEALRLLRTNSASVGRSRPSQRRSAVATTEALDRRIL